MGRLTALLKPNGEIRGTVAGDLVRRLIARTVAQQLAPAIECATAPFQHALSARAGTECIAHVVQALTNADQSSTVLSIDGIRVGVPASHVGGHAQGGGGEIPHCLSLCFSLGQHPALEAISRRLQFNERLLAFLGDIRVVCPRVDSARGVVAPFSDPSAPWQDPLVEQGERRARWSGSFDRSCTGQQPNSHRVAW